LYDTGNGPLTSVLPMVGVAGFVAIDHRDMPLSLALVIQR
jgi:hypothetical protein